MKQKLEGFIITTKNTTMKKLTKITLIIASLLIAVTLVGYYNNTAKDEVNGSTGAPTAIPKVKELEDVKSYTIKSKLFSWGKSYVLETDDNKEFKLQGKDFYFGEDTVKLTNSKGTTLMTDHQISRKFRGHMNRMAELREPDGKVTGYMGEEANDIFSLTRKYHFYDAHGNEIAKATGKLSWSSVYVIEDLDGNTLYEIKSPLVSMTSTYKVKVINSDKLPVEYSTVFAVIMAELDSSKTKNSN